MLAIVAVTIGACALVLLLRPAPDPTEDATEEPAGLAAEPVTEADGPDALADASA
jgi:hypothetical protein